jgi:hypothetical protein
MARGETVNGVKERETPEGNPCGDHVLSGPLTPLTPSLNPSNPNSHNTKLGLTFQTYNKEGCV